MTRYQPPRLLACGRSAAAFLSIALLATIVSAQAPWQARPDSRAASGWRSRTTPAPHSRATASPSARMARQVNFQEEIPPGEVIHEGEGPVIYDEGAVVHEEMVGPGMGGPPMTWREAQEAHFNSPCSDTGYMCNPCWMPLRNHLYFRGEYLYWWARGTQVAPWPNVNNGGLLMNNEGRGGARLTLGYWFNPCRIRGIEMTYIGLRQKNDRYDDQGNIFDAQSDFTGFEGLYRTPVLQGGMSRLDLLLGYRGLRLEDDLRVTEPAGPQLAHLSSDNRFNGLEIGFAEGIRGCFWSLDLQMKVALGNTNTKIYIEEDAATYTFDNFAMVNELNVQLGYQIAPRMRATVGYTFLYWSKVGRTGEHVDEVGAPPFELDTTDYWAQGLDVGLAWRF